MKLLRCYVKAFGGLRDYKVDFNEGLNVFKEDNGFGKSTLTYFIKSMFYGLNNDKKRSINENERAHFKPWNWSGTFGGYLDFEYKGTEFRIERSFGAKEGEDSLLLVNLKTGKTNSNFDDLGSKIFGIDEAGFFSTAYFSEKDIEAKGNYSLTAKFNSIYGNDYDPESVKDAVKKLETTIKTYSMRGGKGKIEDKKSELYEANEQVNNIQSMVKSISSLKNEIDSLQVETKNLKNEMNTLSDKIAFAGKSEVNKEKKRNYIELNNEISLLKNKKCELANTIGGRIPTKQELDAYSNSFVEYNKVKKMSESIKNTQINNNSSNNKKQKTKFNTNIFLLTSICILLLIVGVVLAFTTNFTLGLIISGIGFLSAILVACFSFKLGKTKELLQKNNTETDKPNDYLELCLKYEEQFDLFFDSLGFEKQDYFINFTKLNNLVYDYNNLCERILEIERKLSQLNYVESSEMENNFAYNLEELKFELSEKQKLYIQKTDELSRKKSAYERVEDSNEKLSSYENRVSEIKEELEALKREHEIYSLTYKYLLQADENLKIRYRKPLDDSLNKFYSIITGKNEKAINIDIDLNVTVNESDGTKSIEYYSKGFKNLFEICKRFALVEVLFTDEKPFIILDDPFCNFDDKKLIEAKEVIKKLSSYYQILYFVCHESRA